MGVLLGPLGSYGCSIRATGGPIGPCSVMFPLQCGAEEECAGDHVCNMYEARTVEIIAASFVKVRHTHLDSFVVLLTLAAHVHIIFTAQTVHNALLLFRLV